MAREKFIKGKVDECRHDGMVSYQRKLLTALDQIKMGEQVQISFMVWRDRDKLPPELVSYHEEFLRFWGLIGISSSKENDG